jgi:uncharacterized protein
MNRYEQLKIYIKKYGKVIIAFSGGIDSYLVLKASLDALGTENILAVTADSPSLKSGELSETIRLAGKLGAQHMVITTEEINNPDYTNNPSNRCFFCKDELFTKLDELKISRGYDFVFDGTNYDDMSDYRPGYKAGRNHEIISPLADMKFIKEEIRQLSKEIGLEIWDKPSSPCLSSRIPYGQKVTIEKLRQIEKAEDVLNQMGFKEFRVRHFEFEQDIVNGISTQIKIAKIDVAKVEFDKILNEETLRQINNRLKETGYNYVTFDMEGLKSGSLNVLTSRGIKG